LLTAAVLRLVPVKSWRQRLYARNPYLSVIVSALVVVDITAGDSFSDIYGLRRLFIGTLRKLLALLVGAKLVLLPQTYGPFNRRVSRFLVRVVVSRASALYSRDRQGLQTLRSLLGDRRTRAAPQFCPDLAFVLDAVPPASLATLPGPLPDKGTRCLIGLNVSGLLFNGGYTRDNMFHLKSDYRQLMVTLIERLFADSANMILLIPHVFPLANFPGSLVESDPDACRQLFEQLHQSYRERLFCLQGYYDQSEIKKIIGLCDFFIGSRMHACIAALSQCIPVVGIAYSSKFHGVFESIGVEQCVVDLRSKGHSDALEEIVRMLGDRERISAQLQKTIPKIQAGILDQMRYLFETPPSARCGERLVYAL
jgi:polysaccharide pyruvyl transferase WcaK-like protein